MTHIMYTPDFADEGQAFTVCTQSLTKHHAIVYEAQSNGKVAWFTHGIDPNAKVFDPPGTCNCVEIGKDPFGQPIEVCGPPVHQSNALDYTQSDGKRHYFLAWSSHTTPPANYIYASG